MATAGDGGRGARLLVAGALAGVVTKTATAPLERVKILMQVEGMTATSGRRASAVARARELSRLGVWQTMVRVFEREGVRGLYKGNGANVLRVAPTYALKFAFNDRIRAAFARPGQTGGDISAARLLASGTFAGLMQATITYPLETIRTRLTVGGTLGEPYRGVADCARRTVAREGVGALYKGIAVTWLTGGPYVGIQMSLFTLLQRRYGRERGDPLAVPFKLVCGAAAGLVAQTVTFPGDTVRRRMQTNGANGEPRVYSSSLDCVRQIVRKEGAAALFSGLRANAIRAVPGAAIQFAAYDFFKGLVLR